MLMINRQCIDTLKGLGILGVVLVHYGLEGTGIRGGGNSFYWSQRGAVVFYH